MSMSDIGPTSGFVKPEDILVTDRFMDISSLPSRGYCLLVRAKRHGRWWMLKGLKEPYRHDSVYQVLLQKEYEIVCQLQHPRVVSAFSLEEVEGFGLCIVMEWIEGQTLKEWLAQGKHSRKQRCHVADMLLEALAYVHSRQTQHRDLKPSNIMLTHDGHHLKLIDFGLSDTDSYAILKAPAGTEGYMAPDGSSDIYSLGCILRELRLGWMSHAVVRKCCASQHHRYTDIAAIQRDLHRCWLWPRRLLVIVGLAILLTGLYLMNNSHTQQEQQIVIDTVKVFKVENTERSPRNEEAVSPQRTTVRQHQDIIKDKKKEIDRKVQAYGIEQMLDTVSCQRNIKMPIIRIAHELENAYEEPELKLYIKTRYHRPWSRRINELPYE
jgi:serine/threonine protein kinase